MIPVLLGILGGALGCILCFGWAFRQWEESLAVWSRLGKVRTVKGKDYLVVPADEYRAKVEDLEAARSRLAKLREAMDEARPVADGQAGGEAEDFWAKVE